MFNEQTLKLLLEKSTEIEELCKKNGLENLRIIKPESVDDWNKINILGDEKDKVLITSDLDFLREQVSLLLDCEVMIVTDSMLRNHVKDRIKNEAVPFTKGSEARLTSFFNEILLPKAKRFVLDQQKNDNKKRHPIGFFQEDSKESLVKRNRGEDNSPAISPDSSPIQSREELLANKLFEEHAAEIQSLSPPEKEELIKRFCKSVGVEIQITSSTPAQRV